MKCFKTKNLLIIGLILIPILTYGQVRESGGMLYLDENRRPIYRENVIIPNVGNYQVLKCDFHMHTVFSDGLVWPSIRNQEVWEEGLDSYAITDHIEYIPHKSDVNVDYSRGYELVKAAAAKNNLILIKGSELTRKTPPGHFNAIFIEDPSEFIVSNDNEHDKATVMKAVEQNGFVFWNHPGWQPGIAGSYEWLPFVDDLVKNKALHGIEVINGFGLHMKAIDWCVDNNLTMMASSDIHNLIAHDYDLDKEYVHRTMTLVMAEERTAESIREALDAGRTVAWASKYLVGKEENILALFNACIELMPVHYSETNSSGNVSNYREIRNNSDLYFKMNINDGSSTKKVVLHPRSIQQISISGNATSLSAEVTSTYVRSNKHLVVNIPLQ